MDGVSQQRWLHAHEPTPNGLDDSARPVCKRGAERILGAWTTLRDESRHPWQHWNKGDEQRQHRKPSQATLRNYSGSCENSQEITRIRSAETVYAMAMKNNKDISFQANRVVEAYLAFRDQPNLHANHALIDSLESLIQLHGYAPKNESDHPVTAVTTRP